MNRIVVIPLALLFAACGYEAERSGSAVAQDATVWELTGGQEAEQEAGPRSTSAHGPREASGSASDPAVDPEGQRVVYVDVRRPDEWAAGHVAGAIHIPHTELGERWHELESYRDADIVLYCRTGRRSGIAEEILRQAGFENVENGGGLSGLARQGVPVVR
jgi:phage shock protein E